MLVIQCMPRLWHNSTGEGEEEHEAGHGDERVGTIYRISLSDGLGASIYILTGGTL
jgi:hypothetical protein